MKAYVYVWSEAERVFFSHKESWVLMKFGGRKFKVMFEAFETLRFLTEFHSTFLLKISVSLADTLASAENGALQYLYLDQAYLGNTKKIYPHTLSTAQSSYSSYQDASML